MRSVGADVLKGASVAIVRVDAADLSSLASGGALDVDIALALAGALFGNGQQLQGSSDTPLGTEGLHWATYVATRPVDLSVIIRVEVDDLLPLSDTSQI